MKTLNHFLSVAAIVAAGMAILAAQPNPAYGDQAENMAVMTGTNTQTIQGQKVFQSTGTQDTPLVGLSKSGAAAAIVEQQDHFDSAALVVMRSGTDGDVTDTPTLHVVAGHETQYDDPVFQVTGCLALSGDNHLVYYGGGGLAIPGGVLDNRTPAMGKVSVDPVSRQLIAEDGSTLRLSWESGTVTVPTLTVSGTLTLGGSATVSGLTSAAVSGLGTAATLNVPAAGNAASGEIVKGSDTRLSNARTPTAHTHPATDISDSTAAGRALLTAASAAAQRTALGVQAAPGYGEVTGTDISFASGGVYYKTIAAGTAFTFSNVANGVTVTVEITTTDDVQPTWPGEVTWPGGSAPTQPSTSTVIYQFTVINGAIRGRAETY